MYLNRFATFRRVHAIPRADASEEGGGGRTTGSEQRERETVVLRVNTRGRERNVRYC